MVRSRTQMVLPETPPTIKRARRRRLRQPREVEGVRVSSAFGLPCACGSTCRSPRRLSSDVSKSEPTRVNAAAKRLATQEQAFEDTPTLPAMIRRRAGCPRMGLRATFQCRLWAKPTITGPEKRHHGTVLHIVSSLANQSVCHSGRSTCYAPSAVYPL